MPDYSYVKILIAGEKSNVQRVLLLHLKSFGIKNILLADNAKLALHLVQKQEPDIALIDFDLGVEKAGIDLAKQLRVFTKLPIIFITSSYTMNIYEKVRETNPIAFINTDISIMKLKQEIELALNRDSKEQNTFFKDKIEDIVFIKIGNWLRKINLNDIDWFGIDGKLAYAKIKKKELPINNSLKHLDNNLPKGMFIRIHQSYIINYSKIIAINPIRSTVVIAGTELPLGRSFKKNLLNRISHI